MKRWVPLLGALALLLAGCGRVQNERFTSPDPSPSSLQIEATIPDGLTVGRAAELHIHLRQQGKPVEGATVQVEGNMTHAGMEPLQVEAQPRGAGEYVAPLAWTMSGGWVLTVRATLPDGQSAERTVEGLEVGQP